ncbi:SDR family NAD(P)-dependent oxidoreductase [uncultured Parasphingopyxis sp.]|uniref:SDR family NAD(P)-dependent oxidoreductase n=1 Tax=uncultured Parasphingopyxis sp. TaxID=1547918 RepID=UPI00262360CE|nr:SDR family NAD(P)-dependent oxidoreductase [uncultured Parasphingopyxis sp.]
MKPRYSLEGRTALITGASSGIGAHLAALFGAAGARVLLGARRKDRTEEEAGKIRAAGGEALAVELDVTDEGSVIAAYDAAEKAFGTVDTIVANAGISRDGRSTDVSAGDMQAVVDTNFSGVYLTAREGARRLIAAGSRESGAGRIVLLGSITSFANHNGDATYAAMKAAVAHLGRNLAREWVRMGINVNTVHPGYIETELNADFYKTEGGEAHIRSFHRRRLTAVEALDDPILFFASDASAMVTGSELIVDDGQRL